MAELNKKEIKQKLESEIRKTESLIVEYTELTQPIEPENAIGRISRMDAINNKSVTEAALRKAKVKHENLIYALSNIEDPAFGTCATCKQPIPLGRILIMPHARTCIKCSQ